MNKKKLSNKSIIIILLLIVIVIGLKFTFPNLSLTGSSTKESFTASVEVVEPDPDDLNEDSLVVNNVVIEGNSSNKSRIIISGLTITDEDLIDVIIK